ncbi:HTH domain-containing protein [Actinomadura fibrosa]|uniref:HTH domain-containing protein n=1 Tax=Actinomadura fibrosa TaxID=111802 RepID=A0ABW2Y3F6_9ACTN|nr:helix-turn-helix domain-containing protein [Actinomadura fibrosa]
MNRGDRLLALVPELRAAAPDPLEHAALAERLGVSERTVRRDLELLTHGGLPVEAAKGHGCVLPDPTPPTPLSEVGSLMGPVRGTLARPGHATGGAAHADAAATRRTGAARSRGGGTGARVGRWTGLISSAREAGTRPPTSAAAVRTRRR